MDLHTRGSVTQTQVKHMRVITGGGTGTKAGTEQEDIRRKEYKIKQEIANLRGFQEFQKGNQPRHPKTQTQII